MRSRSLNIEFMYGSSPTNRRLNAINPNRIADNNIFTMGLPNYDLAYQSSYPVITMEPPSYFRALLNDQKFNSHTGAKKRDPNQFRNSIP